MGIPETLAAGLNEIAEDLSELYRDLHAHPELSMQETRTAAIVNDWLHEHGWEPRSGVGGTGVVAVLRNGVGPTVLLRADMDGLPVKEDTGLSYASTATAVDPDGHEQPVMHACGHDTHVTCLLGAAALFAHFRDTWTGSLMLVFQPGEEIGAGARAMVDDDLFARFGRPDVCLGQHVVPLPAGHAAIRSGTTMAASDSIRVRLFGKGGHGSLPQTTVDPIVMAAALVLKLQTVVSRSVSPLDAVVVTVGSLQAGTKENVIPEEAELKLNLRTFDPHVRSTALEIITRIVRAEAESFGASRAPEITPLNHFPLTVNDPVASERVRQALAAELGHGFVHEAPLDPGSEDFGVFGTESNTPSVYWFWGGHNSVAPERLTESFETGWLPSGVPSQHSAKYAPVIDPTLTVGVRCLLSAALVWLGAQSNGTLDGRGA